MTTVAVLGAGRMGAALARRLVATGHHVTVWNRTAARVGAIDGALPAASPGAAVREADIAIVMVTDATAVDRALFGPDGAAPSLRAGSCLLQMSTIAPGQVRALGGRLPAGVALVDAPVAGSVGAAESGGLTLLVGTDDWAAFHRVEPVLAALGTVCRCGGVGAGAALKLVLNTALVTAMGALADALTVAEAVNVDRASALDALRSSALGGAVTRVGVAGAAFSIALAAKDADLALAELTAAQVPVLRATARALHSAEDPTADISTLIDTALVKEDS